MSVISGFFALVLLASVIIIYRQGRTSQRAKDLQEESDALVRAKKWRDRLRVDGDFVKRLRARFRRDVLPPV